MKFVFDPLERLVIVEATIDGPHGPETVRLAVDTGASDTVIDLTALVGMGFDANDAVANVSITTAGSNLSAFVFALDRIEAIGHREVHFPVVSYSMPIECGVQGLLGNDFFKDLVLTIDYHHHTVSLT